MATKNLHQDCNKDMEWKYDESDEEYRNLEGPSTDYIHRYLFKSF